MAKPEWSITPGKKNKMYIRREGTSIIMLQYNKDEPNVTEIENELSERIVAALNYFTGIETKDIVNGTYERSVH